MKRGYVERDAYERQCPCGHLGRYHGSTGCHHPGADNPNAPDCLCDRPRPEGAACSRS